MELFEAIAARRSYKKLVEPAPTDDQLRQMFTAAAQAPDHKELQPWQFIVLRGAKKDAFATAMVEGLKIREPQATEGQIEKISNAPTRAPLIVVVAAKRMPSSLPFDEMYAATCAATQNLLLAATALGFGSIWRTGAPIYDDYVKEWLGMTYGDEIVGFIYLGTAENEPKPRGQIDFTESVIW